MTKEEIENNTVWNEYEQGKCLLHVAMFEKEIPFIFFKNFKPESSISDKMVQSINHILTLDKSKIAIIKELLYEECLFSFQVADYGCEPKEGETDLEAHLREFEIHSKEDAYEKSTIKQINIQQDYDALNGNYSEIKMMAPTDELVSIIIKNGEIIDFDYDGCTLSVFDDDEQAAKKNREKVLNS